jgi:ATP-binding cassette, subfamily F, member 3
VHVLHVEQEIAGDARSVISTVLECDRAREALLAEEKYVNERISNMGEGGSASAVDAPAPAGTVFVFGNGSGSGKEGGAKTPSTSASRGKSRKGASAAASKAERMPQWQVAVNKLHTAAELTAHLSSVYERMSHIDADTACSRAASILSGLQFTEEAQKRATETFSGGWRMRVALACALFLTPDLLILDEPTNHLDLESVLWLESYLADYPSTVLLVSHDR